MKLKINHFWGNFSNKGNFIIKIDNFSDNSIFELYNLQGLKLFEKNVSEGKNKIQLPQNLLKGIYIGKVTDLSNNHQKTIRIAID